MTRIGVVIPTFNRCESLSRCLASLATEVTKADWLTVVDAGSTDGTVERVRRDFPDATLIEATPDAWWAGLVNIGVKALMAKPIDYVLTFNDDNMATPGFLEALRKVAERHPSAIVASVCCYLNDPQRIFFAGRVKNRWFDRYQYLDLDSNIGTLVGEVREVELLHGMCTLIPRKVFERVGLFDEQAFPHLFADDDLVLRAGKRGYARLVALRSVVLNDRTSTGYNPYDRRLGIPGFWRLLRSRRSVYEIDRRAHFLWRHRSSGVRFLLTFVSDYLRLVAVVVARWVLPVDWFRGLGMRFNRLGARR
jgi:GT2 family glycosyltransferase